MVVSTIARSKQFSPGVEVEEVLILPSNSEDICGKKRGRQKPQVGFSMLSILLKMVRTFLCKTTEGENCLESRLKLNRSTKNTKTFY